MQESENKRRSGNVFGWKWSFIGLGIILVALALTLIQNRQTTGSFFPIVIEKVAR